MRLINVDMTDSEISDKVQEISANADVYLAVRKVLASFPIVEAERIRHAHWIPKQLGNCECSNCHEEYGVCGGLLGDYNYCPSCGAKMDKKEQGK